MRFDDGIFGLYAQTYENRREVELSLEDYLRACSDDSSFYAGPAERLLKAIGDPIMVDTAQDPRLGRISLASATQYSDNTVYAQLTQLVGPGAIVRTAKSLGITSPLKSYFAIGLGAEAVNPLEMARAFSAFANGGNRFEDLGQALHGQEIGLHRNDDPVRGAEGIDGQQPQARQTVDQDVVVLGLDRFE